MGTDTVTTDASALSDAELAAQVRRLEEEERTVSKRRSALHDRIDFVAAGVAVAPDCADDQLASLRASERELSDRRNTLHVLIDELRTERSRRRAAR